MEKNHLLSPLQFGEDDELDGPLGSFGEPGNVGNLGTGYQGIYGWAGMDI